MRKSFSVLLSVGVFLCIATYLGWMILSNHPVALQSELHPILVGKAIISQFAQASPLSEWNIPFFSLGFWALWLFAIYSNGISVITYWNPDNNSLPCSSRAVLSFAIGFVTYAVLQLISGMAGFLGFGLIPLFFVLNLFHLTQPAHRRELLALPRAVIWQWRALPLSGRLACAALLLPVLMLLVPALTPPVQSDGMRYHLGAVQEYLKLDAIRYLPHNAYSNMPFLVEMHFLGALALHAPEAAQLMHLTLALFTVLAIYSIIRHLSQSPTQSASSRQIPRWLCLLSAVLYLATPMSAVLATWPFTDHGMPFFLLASVLAALLCTDASATLKTWKLLGLCTGGLIGTKYTLAPVAVVLMAIPWLAGSRTTKSTSSSDQPPSETLNGEPNHSAQPSTLPAEQSPSAQLPALAGKSLHPPLGEVLPAKKTTSSLQRNFHTASAIRLRHTIIGLAMMAAIGGVWYLKNLLFTGSPFYPLGSRWFPGGEWTSINDQFLHARAGAKGMGRGLIDFFILPWNATFRWIPFEAHNPGATILIATVTALCALIPTACKSLNRKRLAVFAVALLTFIIWFFTYQSNRLLLPTIAVALSLTPAYLFAQNRLPRQLFAASVGLAAACGFAWAIQWSWVATALSPPPLPYLLGAQDAKTYRYKSLTYARAFDYLNQRVAPEEKVLLIGEHRIYGAEFKALWSDWFDTPVLASILRKNKITSTPALLAHLRLNNIRWILINERELAPQIENAFRPWFSKEEWQLFEELRSLSGPGIKSVNLPPGVTLYHLTEANQ